jgi:hypothetical protein
MLHLCKLAPNVPSASYFYQDLWNNRKMSKRSLKRTAQQDCSKSDRDPPRPSKKQARVQVQPLMQPVLLLPTPTPQSLPDTTRRPSLDSESDPMRPVLPLPMQTPQSLPDTTRRPSLDSPSDPETFRCALNMLVVAWKETYPTVKFPLEKVCFLPMSKSPLASSLP